MELQNSNVIVNENFRRSAQAFFDKLHPDVIKMKESTEQNGNVEACKREKQELDNPPPKTTYMETLTHLFKGNVGPGCFAMSHAVKNGKKLKIDVARS
jgi:hypothetical protein